MDVSAQDHLHDPFLIPDMEQAVERLHLALSRQEQVCFYGDYDVDGVSATSLYLSFYRGLGGNAQGYIPHRLREGYGLNEAAIRQLAAGRHYAVGDLRLRYDVPS